MTVGRPPLYVEPDLRRVSLGAGVIAVREAGEGAALPLILLHGIGSNASAWAGQFAGFAAGRRVVAWNAPGYANSTPLPMARPAPEDYGASLIALLDALAIERAVLVGQSLGAIMATAAALRRPDRFAGLVLASPASGYATPANAVLPERVAERIAEVERLGPFGLAGRRAHRLLTARATSDARALVHRVMCEVDVEGYSQASRMLAHADLAGMVAGLTMPTLVMWGDEDIITPPAGCARIAAAVPDRRTAVLPGLGHAFATEAPAIFNQALAAFLAELETVTVD